MMEIKIKAQTEDGEEDIIFSDDQLDNTNFIEVIIGDKTYTLIIKELKATINAFLETYEI